MSSVPLGTYRLYRKTIRCGCMTPLRSKGGLRSHVLSRPTGVARVRYASSVGGGVADGLGEEVGLGELDGSGEAVGEVVGSGEVDGSGEMVGKPVGASEGISLGSNVAVGEVDGENVIVGSSEIVGMEEGAIEGSQVEPFPYFPTFPYPSCVHDFEDFDLDLDFDLEVLLVEEECFPAYR